MSIILEYRNIPPLFIKNNLSMFFFDIERDFIDWSKQKDLLSYYLFIDNKLVSFALLSGCIKDSQLIYILDYIYTIKEKRNNNFASYLMNYIKNIDQQIIVISFDNNPIINKICKKK